MERPLARGSLLVGLTAITLAAWASPSAADRDERLLMPMDSHLLEADFIGEVRVLVLQSLAQSAEWGIDLEVVEPWFSRWPPTSTLYFPVRPGAVTLEAGGRYVVLLSGGPYRESPFTHRDNSVFAIGDDDAVTCASGIPLFGVTTGGFMCSVQPLVIGAPLDIDEMRRQLDRARSRAVARQPERASDLDALARPLADRPDPAAEVMR